MVKDATNCQTWDDGVELNSIRKIPKSLAAAARLLSLVFALSADVLAEEHILVAVATNFTEVAERLQGEFENDTAYRVGVVSGSSGKLYAQIIQGAPFDILLSADQGRPSNLVRRGVALRNSQFTYAIGRLALWSADPDLLGEGGRSALHRGNFRKLALANPDLAPYGRAAFQALKSFGLHDVLRDKLVMGENVGQAYAMIATQNADLGFVALSQLVSPRSQIEGSRWMVPAHHYAPVRQDAVLLNDRVATRAFADYLRSPKSREIIRSFGYLLDEADTTAAHQDSD